MSTNRVFLNKDEKEILEEITGLKIHLRNTFDKNQTEINDLLELSKQNALIYLQRNKMGQRLSIFEENNLFIAIKDLQNNLRLKKLPRKIECYDISHFSGTFVYGSMVTFIDGRPAKKFYRLFRCKDQNNDFANHSEVLKRRLNRFIKDNDPAWNLPDLIIVDGGKGQLSSDFKVLQEFDFTDVEMVGLAKKEEEVFILGDTPENLKLGSQGGILLEGNSKFLIQRIRDEAHRFAITNHRKAKLKTASKSKLDEISGIGPKTKQKILQTFGSVENMVDSLYKNPDLIYELLGENQTIKLQKHFGVK
jgi:excinuclease ABC subunit C